MSLVVDQVARMIGSCRHRLDVHGPAQFFQVHEIFVLGHGLFSHTIPTIFWNFSSVLKELQKGRSGPS